MEIQHIGCVQSKLVQFKKQNTLVIFLSNTLIDIVDGTAHYDKYCFFHSWASANVQLESSVVPRATIDNG